MVVIIEIVVAIAPFSSTHVRVLDIDIIGGEVFLGTVVMPSNSSIHHRLFGFNASSLTVAGDRTARADES